jgi:hypothetical protein
VFLEADASLPHLALKDGPSSSLSFHEKGPAMQRFPRCAILALMVLLGWVTGLPPSAHAGLIGLSSSNPGRLYSVNSATGSATLLTSLGHETSLVGLEYLDATVYTTDVLVAGTFHFGSINLTTGVFTPLNDQGGSLNWHALAGDATANLLYTVDLNQPAFPLLSVTPLGVVITIGNTNQNIRGLAFDSDNDILYGVTFNDLFTINTVTGAATLVGATGLDVSNLGLAYDSNRLLYLNVADTNSLYRLNTTTGAATLVGDNNPAAALHIDGLAYIPEPVPEPTSAALLGLGGLGLAGYVSRRRKQAPAA